MAEADALSASGLALLPGPFASSEEAFDAAAALLAELPADRALPPLEVIGDFVIPPVDGPPSRDFQTLHIDFGLPVDPAGPGDVARFTALHVSADRTPGEASTRLVPLSALFAQNAWPAADELLARLVDYGARHGGRDGIDGYTEGSLARIVEGAAGRPPRLSSIRADPEFLCGNEFGSLAQEVDFFAGHGLSLDAAQRDVKIDPGALVVFDNLAFGHGRRGRRAPGELHQRLFGHRALGVAGQRLLRDRVLAAFASD